MKKMMLIILGVTMMLTITGCGEQESNNDVDNDTNSSTKYSFTQLENDFKQLDSTLEVNEKSATLVSATEGYGYIMSDCSIEVYKFDTSSEAYKTAEKNQELSMPSFDMTLEAVVKNGYAYLVTSGSCDNAITYTDKLN